MTLHKTIVELIAAQDKFDSQAFVDNSSDDAIVYDEGGIYRGKKEIREWNQMTNTKYRTKLEPLNVAGKKGEIELTVKVSGTFDGSPINLKYHFEMENDKISSLRITNA